MNPQDASRRQRLHERPAALQAGERPLLQGHLKKKRPSAEPIEAPIKPQHRSRAKPGTA